MTTISIIIPAKNEAQGLRSFLSNLQTHYPHAEIIIVNDGSSDETAHITMEGITLINHPYSIGNGGAIKTGARNAHGDLFIFMDGDGQHTPESIAPLLEKYNTGYDMVVGARDKKGQANNLRWIGNSLYNFIASKIVGQTVFDLTSGLRVVNARKFKEFIHLLPNGFSSPSTITMAFFRAGYSVTYVPINTLQRHGKSHLRPFSDGIKFLIILYKMTILYSPLKIFIPLAMLIFFAGCGNYFYTYITQGRFTNMSGVLISVSIVIFLIGMISEQITSLMYQRNN